MIPDVALNRVKTLLTGDITNGEAGTAYTAPSASDTALASAVPTTIGAVTQILSDKSIQTTHIIDSTIATSSTFYEWAVYMNSSSTVILSRAVTAGVSHTSTDEISKVTTFYIREV